MAEPPVHDINRGSFLVSFLSFTHPGPGQVPSMHPLYSRPQFTRLKGISNVTWRRCQLFCHVLVALLQMVVAAISIAALIKGAQVWTVGLMVPSILVLLTFGVNLVLWVMSNPDVDELRFYQARVRSRWIIAVYITILSIHSLLLAGLQFSNAFCQAWNKLGPFCAWWLFMFPLFGWFFSVLALVLTVFEQSPSRVYIETPARPPQPWLAPMPHFPSVESISRESAIMGFIPGVFDKESPVNPAWLNRNRPKNSKDFVTTRYQ